VKTVPDRRDQISEKTDDAATIGRTVSGPVPLRLRPLEVGDLLDETFRMYRRHFMLFAGISVLLAIPLAALAGYSFFTLFANLVQQIGPDHPLDVNSLTPALVPFALFFLVNLALYPFLYGAITYAACESALGRPVTVWGALGAALRRYIPIAAYLFLLVLMVLTFCLFPLWIWISVGWIAVLPVMFVEKTGLIAAMRRSWRLVQGRWWRTFLILFLMFILVEVVSSALGAFLYLGQTLLQIVLSTYLSLAISEAASVVISSLVNPILQIAIVLIYFDLRVRQEGLDLFQLAQHVASPQPSA
jgi:Membrane domain of glycerophosphoryl diester phosphodiesterase